MNKRTLSIQALTILLILYSASGFAIKPIYSGGRDRAAIRGYDVVAYFSEQAPVKGLEEFSTTHLGAKWFFANKQNKILFESDPEKYKPQFGGYCAYAVARNTSASTKPQYFTIYNGKLYLNYSKSVHKKWSKDKDEYIIDAKKNWQNILNK